MPSQLQGSRSRRHHRLCRTTQGSSRCPRCVTSRVTAPYMHDGSFKTLREVIDYYNEPDKVVPHSKGRDASLSPQLNLSEQEKRDLEAFLQSLTDDRFT